MTADPLRIVFAGTPDFAAAHLAALLEAGYHIVAAYTQPDRPAGRGKKLVASPVKTLALSHGIPVFQPIHLKDPEDQAALAALKPDLMVVVAYGLLLPQAVLDIPRMGCINVHASLLPRWRGAAPIQRAIEAGDTETGVCIMQMEAGLDTGPVLATARCPILPEDTGGSLHDRLALQGAHILVDNLKPLQTGQLIPHAQPTAGITYAHKLGKEDARLDFSLPATDLVLKIKAFNPFPVSWCLLPDGSRLRVWSAQALDEATTSPPGTVLACDQNGLLLACGSGCLRLTDMQLPNRNRMSIRDLINGHLLALQAGDRLE